MGIKILLADDSVTAQNMGKKILSEAGHDVVTVSNGAAAAKKIAEVKPELVLLDVFMPGYSGLELCEKLRNSVETAKLPVLLTVGRMEPYSPQDGARVKADGVIVKPFEATDLTAAVDRFAQKAKAPGGYEHTIKIPAPPGSRDDTGRESQKVVVSTPGGGEPRAYEQTMRLDPAQIAALLNKPAKPAAGVPEPESSVAAVPVVEEFATPRPQATEIPSAQASSPALGSDLLPEPHTKESQPTSIPSYMAQYLDQPAEDAESAVTARPAVGPAAEFDIEKTVVIPHDKIPTPLVEEFPAHEQLSPTIPISDELVPQRYPGDINPPSASVEGLELTSAPPVPDVPVAPESGLETTIQTLDTPTTILKDPALVTDPYRATMDFPTQFGVPEPPAADLSIPAETASGPVDEFEARLQAAMASYEAPTPDLPLPTSTETVANLHSGLGGELPPPTGLQPEVASELPSPIEASAAVDELDEPFFATAPIGSTDLALPEPIDPTAVAHDSIPSNVVEFPSATHVPPAPTEPPQLDVIAEEAKPEVLIETTSVVGSSTQHLDSPVAAEKAELVPMAMAAAAASAPIVTPSHPNYEAEAELARALKAAMGAESDTSSIPVAVHDAEGTPSGEDANRLAAAVEKVMQRELPGLIWKIMAELDVRKR